MRILDDRPELWPYVLASVVVHLLLLLLIPKMTTVPKFEDKPIEVFAVQEVPAPAEGKTPFRIADIAKPAVEQRPKTASFLGLYDSAVPEERVGVANRPGAAGAPRLKTKIGGPTAKAKPAPAPQKRLASKDRIFAFNKALFDDRESAVERETAGSEERVGGMDDFFPDFKRGANTYLNVLRYPGIEYFVRLKRAFKIAFNPEPSLREYFSSNIVTRGSVDVVLGVSVGRDGRLSELFVFRSSGIGAYDQEALRTVRVSAPFSSPPEKFVADDGLLRMSWTFSVYL